MILLQIGRKILLISTAALNFVFGVVVAALLQAFGSSSDIINFVVVVFICLFAFSFAFGWT